MAWSNVGREPRREITEQVIGFVVGGSWLYFCWHTMHPIGLAAAFDVPSKYIFPVLFTFGMAVLGPLALLAVWHIAHDFGESVCRLMAGMGFDPRPRKRY